VPLDVLRPHVPSDFVLGTSVGSPAEAEQARGWRADYWSVGPSFATANKPDAGVPLGAAGFAALARLAPGEVPVIAVGGVTAGNAASLARAGAAGLAVIGAILAAPDPESATRAIRDSFDSARGADVPPR
jgi:thiamine-phosphate pyrophosphorylase